MPDDERLREELAQHLAALTAGYEHRGMSPEAARRAARLKLGGEDQITESWRSAHRFHWLDDLRRDLALGVRSLRRSPGFTLVVVLSLALGIGANAAIFSLLDAAVWQKLPVREPDQLALLYWHAHRRPKALNQSGLGGPPGTGGEYSLSYPTFQYLRDHSARVFSSIFGFAPLGFGKPSAALEVHGQTELAQGELVTGDFFSGLGVSAARGRLLNRSDEQAGAPEAMVLSYAYWTQRFGRSDGVVGRTVSLAGTPATIVGVAAQGFHGVQRGWDTEFWVAMSPTTPASLAPWGYAPSGGSVYGQHAYWWLMMMARLQPGVTRAQAVAALGPAFRNLAVAALNPSRPDAAPALGLVPGSQGINLLQDVGGQMSWILMAVAGLLLLLACVNVASLLLARATARRREIAVRLALGARRGRLIRQLLTESVLLACIGGACGVALAPLGFGALTAFVGAAGAFQLDAHASLNAGVLAFAAGISVLAGILFGLAPALRCTRVPIGSVIQSGRAETGERVRLRADKGLAAGQVALSLVLLVAAGLFLRSLNALQSQPLGFNPNHLLLFSVDASQAGYKGASLTSLDARLRQRLAALPGVRAATASRIAPLTGWESDGDLAVPGVKLTSQQAHAYKNAVAPDFLKTMGIPLLAGRRFTDADAASTHRVAIANTTLAQHLFGKASPLGRTVADGKLAYTIVGLAADARYSQISGPMPPTLYYPYTQGPSPVTSLVFELRLSAGPQSVEPAVRRIVHQIDPSLAIADMRLQTDQDAAMLQQPRLFSQISGFFGLLGLLLAAIGIEGTMAYAVTRRRGEIGVRMALGAERGQVLRAVLRETAGMALAGVVIGIGLALAAGRYLGSQLYQVTPADPLTIAAAAAVLFLVALAAGWWPAQRASQTDPMRALRTE